jgi:16S rRNA G1207 methylase RsmC
VDVALKHYPIGGLEIELETSPNVFFPTSTSQILASVLDIAPGATVLDIGCGVGVLAIVAALKGARRVYAVDIMEEACELARVNAERNHVSDRVQVLCGDLFEPLGSLKFDVIIDDVSGIADEVARLSPWFPPPIPTGGYDGTDHVVRMLKGAINHLREGGSLYLPVLSLSNTGRILQVARSVFGEHIEPLVTVDFPFGAELKEQEHTLSGLRAQGIIDYKTRRSRHFWSLQIYRAWIE